MSRPVNNQKGFTILELLIATMVFSVIFLGVTTALIQLSKLYYKGVVSGRTQELTQGATDQLAQQLQFSDASFSKAGPTTFTVSGTPLQFSAVCIGNTRYSYAINTQVNDTIADKTYDSAKSRLRHALWRDTMPTGGLCAPADLSAISPSSATNKGEEVLGKNMRLSDFAVDCNDLTNICKISIGIIYGDNDLLEYNASGLPVKCQTIIGNQWCATTKFTTTVLRRVRS
ncbi:MAG: prepilin-type N-terminal cleavage/methylation domain-containing protein [Candidatus Saccharimonadales bacterium]